MITTLDQVTSADWSLALDATAGGGPGSGIGYVVEGLDDIAQCIAIILTTPPGSDPLRPEFACDLFQFIDQPIDLALPALVAAATDALERWEPRMRVVSISAVPGDAGQLIVSVVWELLATGRQLATSTSVAIGGGGVNG